MVLQREAHDEAISRDHDQLTENEDLIVSRPGGQTVNHAQGVSCRSDQPGRVKD